MKDARIFYEMSTYDDGWMTVIVDEDYNEYSEEDFEDGDILILEDMPYDLWDESTWSFIHATGRAIWSSTRYPNGGWVTEYED